MQHIRVSSARAPVQKLGHPQQTSSPRFQFSESPSARSMVLPAAPLWSTDIVSLAANPAFQPLIPGLPDDIALSCLLRLPLGSHAACRAVCRRWRATFNNEQFFCLRRSLGFSEPWLFIFGFHRCTGKIQWQALDPSRMAWQILPAMPCKERVCPPGFGCAAIADAGMLFVCGGMLSDMDCPLDSVLRYEMHRNRWTVMDRMTTPRSFFASGMIDGCIYIAGGNSTDLYELSSAEVFDPVKGYWRPVANMGANMAPYDAAVLNGKLYVTEGWLWPFVFNPRGQVYDPKLDRWENMTVGMRQGWTGVSVVLDGHLFVISDHENAKLKVYDMATDSWSTVSGPPIPGHMSRPFSANSINGRLYVIGRSLHVVVGTVTQSLNEGKLSFTVEWQSISAPNKFYDFTPSSSQVLKAIVHMLWYLVIAISVTDMIQRKSLHVNPIVRNYGTLSKWHPLSEFGLHLGTLAQTELSSWYFQESLIGIVTNTAYWNFCYGLTIQAMFVANQTKYGCSSIHAHANVSGRLNLKLLGKLFHKTGDCYRTCYLLSSQQFNMVCYKLECNCSR